MHFVLGRAVNGGRYYGINPVLATAAPTTSGRAAGADHVGRPVCRDPGKLVRGFGGEPADRAAEYRQLCGVGAGDDCSVLFNPAPFQAASRASSGRGIHCRVKRSVAGSMALAASSEVEPSTHCCQQRRAARGGLDIRRAFAGTPRRRQVLRQPVVAAHPPVDPQQLPVGPSAAKAVLRSWHWWRAIRDSNAARAGNVGAGGREGHAGWAGGRIGRQCGAPNPEHQGTRPPAVVGDRAGECFAFGGGFGRPRLSRSHLTALPAAGLEPSSA